MTNNATPSQLREAILETARDMRRLGIMDLATREKITLRHLAKEHGRRPRPSGASKRLSFHDKDRGAMTEREPPKRDDPVADASRLAAERDEMRRRHAEPSLGQRLGQIGVLGWAIVLPALAGLFLGRWLDQTYASGVFFSAPLLMVGAGVGFWLAWKWMSRQ
jgi:ATP synthase protein I